MADFVALAIWPLAMGAFAALFSLNMYWRITKQHPIETAKQDKPFRTMAE